MKIRYIPLSTNIASVRLRCLLPARYLRDQGHEITVSGPADWAVLCKHGWGEEEAVGARRLLFDVCDDHFDTEHSEHYQKWIDRADVVTCNSKVMAEIILARTGREAVVIPDPYESPEYAPKCHKPLLWFGKGLNLVDLFPLLDQLPEIMIVSDVDHPRVLRWSFQSMEKAWEACGLVVIPTGKKQGKSANRALESIRRGIYPVCGILPAYSELGLGEADIPYAVMEALKNPGHTIERVMDLQDRIRVPFSPETIGRQWEQCFV